MSGKPSSSAPAPIDSEWRTDDHSVASRPTDADLPSSTWRAVALDPALREQLAMEELLMLERASLEEDDG